MQFGGILIAVGSLAVAIQLGGHVTAFIDVPGALLVLCVGTGIVLSAHGPSACALLLRTPSLRRGSKDTARIKAIAETGIQAFVAAGWIGVLIGVVQMLGAMDDPATIGAGMAVALLTALYGYCIAYLVCMPLARAMAIDE